MISIISLGTIFHILNFTRVPFLCRVCLYWIRCILSSTNRLPSHVVMHSLNSTMKETCMVSYMHYYLLQFAVFLDGQVSVVLLFYSLSVKVALIYLWHAVIILAFSTLSQNKNGPLWYFQITPRNLGPYYSFFSVQIIFMKLSVFRCKIWLVRFDKTGLQLSLLLWQPLIIGNRWH